jgi:hypothetical protein
VFPLIRLLNDRVVVKDTIDTPSVSVIMAMSMEKAFVPDFFSPTLRPWRYVIDFDQIRVLEKQPTPTTFSLLLT